MHQVCMATLHWLWQSWWPYIWACVGCTVCALIPSWRSWVSMCLLCIFPIVAVCSLWHLDWSCLRAVPLSDVGLLILISSGFDLARPLNVTQMWPHYRWLTWLAAFIFLPCLGSCVSALRVQYMVIWVIFLFMFRACFFKLIAFLPIKCVVLWHQTLIVAV